MDMRGPLILLTIRPNTWADEENLRRGLLQITADDPTVSVSADDETNGTVIGAIGEVQLEIVLDRLKREFNVEANVGKPQVSYKERLTRPAAGEMKYARQTGGRGRYAHVSIRVFPGEPGTGYVFENDSGPGSIPRGFIEPIEKGIKDACTRGVLAGWPIDDVRVLLYDGSYHDADSSDEAFRIAGAMAFQEAARKAQPVLLEPIMRIEVAAP
jgi:elongation factor G